MSTFMANASTVQPNWWVIDGTDLVVGRLAVLIANLLRGKHNPAYTPHCDTGDFVVVTNVDKVKFTGKKWEQKLYSHYTHHAGGLKQFPAREIRDRKPEHVLFEAVRRMVPRNRLGRKQMTKLKLFVESTHPHQAQQPKEIPAVLREALS